MVLDLGTRQHIPGIAGGLVAGTCGQVYTYIVNYTHTGIRVHEMPLRKASIMGFAYLSQCCLRDSTVGYEDPWKPMAFV